MNTASFLDNLRECKTLLDKWGLLSKPCIQNLKNPNKSKFSKEFLDLSNKNKYSDLYICAISNDDFDFLLKDQSFIQFACDSEPGGKSVNFRFAFYPTIDSLTYEEYLVQIMGIDEKEIEKTGDKFRANYEKYIENEEHLAVNMFRYDYVEPSYVENVHSASHMHFSTKQDVRLPINTQLKPSGFIKMILEYFYYDEWKKRIAVGDNSIWISKHDTDILDKKYFTVKDQDLPYCYITNRKI